VYLEHIISYNLDHFEARKIMKIDNFVESILKVTASDNLDISSDLQSSQTKNINELIEDEKNKQVNEKNVEQKTEEN
jgi:hypothetical protein